jgi:hypothetical protein
MHTGVERQDVALGQPVVHQREHLRKGLKSSSSKLGSFPGQPCQHTTPRVAQQQRPHAAGSPHPLLHVACILTAQDDLHWEAGVRSEQEVKFMPTATAAAAAAATATFTAIAAA